MRLDGIVEMPPSCLALLQGFFSLGIVFLAAMAQFVICLVAVLK
jgi:hypothetical protein